MSDEPGKMLPRKSKGLAFARLQRMAIVLLLGLLCAYASFESPTFLSWANIVENLMTNAAALGVIALGMTFVMVAGGFDLSVGSTTVVCMIVLVMMMNLLSGCGAMLAISGAVIVTLFVGAVLGAVNGTLIAYVGVNPFVVTLSTMLVFRGIALIITGGGQTQQVADMELSAAFSTIYEAQMPLFGGDYTLPAPILIFFAVFIIGFYLLRFTRFGHYIYAIGGNEEAAWLAGVDTKKTKAATYILCGLTCAIAAAILVAMTNTAGAESQKGKELEVIASVIVGGTPLGGGQRRFGFYRDWPDAAENNHKPADPIQRRRRIQAGRYRLDHRYRSDNRCPCKTSNSEVARPVFKKGKKQ